MIDTKEHRPKVQVLRLVIPAGIVLAAAGVVVLLALFLPERQHAKPAPKRRLVPVETLLIDPIPELPITFELMGKVTPDRVVEVSSEVAGRIEYIDVTEGSVVEPGARIIRLNTNLLQAAYDGAKATYDFDKSDVARILSAFRGQAASEKEVDQAKARAATSKAKLDSAAALLDRATMYAPIKGVLDKVVPEVGMYCKAGDVVFKIVDMEPALVVVNVPERHVPYLSFGDEELIITEDVDDSPAGAARPAAEGGDGFRRRTLTGKITFISEEADLSTNTTRVEISVPNSPRVLRSGQIVRAKLSRGRPAKDVILVPLEAVIPLEQGKALYVVGKDGHAERRNPVRIGVYIRRGGVQMVQILEGLKAGDRLIIKGHRYVAHGQEVKVVNETGPEGAPPPAATSPSPAARPGPAIGASPE